MIGLLITTGGLPIAIGTETENAGLAIAIGTAAKFGGHSETEFTGQSEPENGGQSEMNLSGQSAAENGGQGLAESGGQYRRIIQIRTMAINVSNDILFPSLPFSSLSVSFSLIRNSSIVIN